MDKEKLICKDCGKELSINERTFMTAPRIRTISYPMSDTEEYTFVWSEKWCCPNCGAFNETEHCYTPSNDELKRAIGAFDPYNPWRVDNPHL